MKETIYKSILKTHYMWIIVFMLVVASIYITIQTATSGAELAQLERSRQELARENQRLSSRLIRMSSLTNIEVSAENEGFVEATNTVYLTEPSTFATLR